MKRKDDPADAKVAAYLRRHGTRAYECPMALCFTKRKPEYLAVRGFNGKLALYKKVV